MYNISDIFFYSTHVLTEDTVSREIRGDKLYTKRLITKMSASKLPSWCSYVIPVTRKTVIVEESIVDRKNQVITTYTRNLGLNHIAVSTILYSLVNIISMAVSMD